METRYFAFLDESGQREYGPRTDRYYVVLGTIARAEQADAYATELQGVKRAFFRAPKVELKSNWLRRPEECRRRYLDPYGISESKLERFVEAMYSWLLATDLTFIAGVIDKRQMCEEYTKPHHASALGYLVFCQRYQKFLAQRHSRGGVTFDNVSGASQAGRPWRRLLERQHTQLKQRGCPYTNMGFPNLEETMAFADSADVDMLQVSDIAAYNTFRQFKDHGAVWDDPVADELLLYEYFHRLLPRFHQSADGVFAGFGVAKMPTRAHHRWLGR